MLYYITYGCDCEIDNLIIDATSEEEALEYTYQKSIEVYQSYEGSNGIYSIEDILNDGASMDESYEIYQEIIENSIIYSVEDYSPFNEEHRSFFEEYGIFEI